MISCLGAIQTKYRLRYSVTVGAPKKQAVNLLDVGRKALSIFDLLVNLLAHCGGLYPDFLCFTKPLGLSAARKSSLIKLFQFPKQLYPLTQLKDLAWVNPLLFGGWGI